MHWSEKYIGNAYVPDKGDCAALAEQVAREVFGKVIGLPTSHARTYREQARQILELRDDYARRIDLPRDGCPVLFNGRGHTCHIGVMCWIAHEWYVLHASQSFGAVVRERLRDMTALGLLKVEGYYEWI